MTISADVVKDLRERTGAGMMDCKRALADAGGDMEKAIDALRKSGLAKAAKRSGRTAAEGLIGEMVSANTTILVEVNCETDFVCKTDEFRNYVKNITEHVSKTQPKDMDVLLASTFNGKKLSDLETDMVSKVGEKLGVRRFVIKHHDGKTTKAFSYLHAGSKIGVIAVFEDPNNKLTESIGKDVAMHVAAMNPQFVRKSDVPETVIAQEKEIYKAQMATEKKPPEVLEKIILGKVNKFLSEVCLEDQIFVRDTTGKQSVSSMLKALDPAIKIKEIVRMQVGEAAK